jgi:hypothetical protein
LDTLLHDAILPFLECISATERHWNGSTTYHVIVGSGTV